jgi:phosphoribosylformylglycinamidine synthase
MAIAVDKNNKDNIEAILKKHEVEFSDIGVFTDSERAVVHANGEKVVDMDMNFIHNGFPQRKLKPAEYRLTENERKEAINKFIKSYSLSLKNAGNYLDELIKSDFLEMHKRPNLGSVASFMDKMDSTVKGLSVQHCIQGKGRVSTKTSCTLVDADSKEGLIQSYGHCERQTYIDAERMGKNAFLRSIGHNIAMGGRLDYMVATDQALWQSSDKPEYQQMLIEANAGMAKVIEGCEIPVISGKDSMYNQATVYDEDGNVVKRGVFPTILMTTMAKIDDVDKIVTIDAKEGGDLVYIVGASTKSELGGSEYMNMYGERIGAVLNIGTVSDEDIPDVFDTFKRMNKANNMGVLQSAIYIEASGIVMAARDTATAGEIGIELDLDKVHQVDELDWKEQMYSETEGRFLVTIKPENRESFEQLFDGKYSKVGVMKGSELKINKGEKKLLSEPIGNLSAIYHKRAA